MPVIPSGAPRTAHGLRNFVRVPAATESPAAAVLVIERAAARMANKHDMSRFWVEKGARKHRENVSFCFAQSAF